MRTRPILKRDSPRGGASGGSKREGTVLSKQVLDEWDGLVQDPGDTLDGPMAQTAVSDVLAHEQDIRTAINEPGAGDDEAIVPSVEMGLSWLAKKGDGFASTS